MLFTATVTQWSGLGKDTRVTDTTNGTVFLLNSNRTQGLQVRASTKSSFLYVDNPYNYREKPAYIEATESAATITTNINKTYATLVPAFLLYTDNDVSAATYTRQINVDSIVMVRKDPAYPTTKTFITYLEGSTKKEVRCAYSIAQVEELCDDNDLTT